MEYNSYDLCSDRTVLCLVLQETPPSVLAVHGWVAHRHCVTWKPGRHRCWEHVLGAIPVLQVAPPSIPAGKQSNLYLAMTANCTRQRFCPIWACKALRVPSFNSYRSCNACSSWVDCKPFSSTSLACSSRKVPFGNHSPFMHSLYSHLLAFRYLPCKA